MKFRKKSEKNVAEKIFRQSLITYILSDIAYTAGPLVDGIVTGNYLGVDAVSAVSLIAPSIMIFTFFSGIFAVGSQGIYTELLGQGKIDEANSVFTMSNILAVIFSLVIAFLILVSPHSIMRLLGGVQPLMLKNTERIIYQVMR